MTIPAVPPTRHWRRESAYALLAAAGFAGLCALLLAAGVPYRFDHALMMLADPAAPWRARMLDFTALGSSTLVMVFAAGGTLLLLDVGRVRDAVQLAFAALGSGLLVEVLKPLYARSRPDLLPVLADFSNTSFPSGHALMAAALYFTLAWLLGSGASRPRRLLIWTLALGLVGAVALSRVYLRVHYPSDVLAGVIFGGFWAFAVGAGVRAFDAR